MARSSCPGCHRLPVAPGRQSDVINAVIELTYIGSSFDAAIYSFLQYLLGVPIAGAAALWAWRAHPFALPGQKPNAA